MTFKLALRSCCLSALLVFLAPFLLVATARAQVIQGCASTDFVDRTAVGASREIPWDFDVAAKPEHCMQVRVGQTVTWNGDPSVHPVGSSGGDNPNPIGLNVNGVVTFTQAGTFGYVCLNHTVMVGAIKVVAAPSAPSLTTWQGVALAGVLAACGLVAVRRLRGDVR